MKSKAIALPVQLECIEAVPSGLSLLLISAEHLMCTNPLLDTANTPPVEQVPVDAQTLLPTSSPEPSPQPSP